MTKKAKKSIKKPTPISVEDVVKDFTDAWMYAKTNYHSKWADAWKLYNNKRVKRNYEGIADSFIPETHTIIESLVANIAGSKPKFSFLPTNEEQETETDVLNNMLDYFWEENKMNIKSQIWVRDMLLYGTGVLHMSWDGKVPRVKNIPLRDFFVDRNATELTVESARYAGYRYLGDIDKMKKEQVYDAEKKEWVPKYTGLDDIGTTSQKWEDLDKTTKEMYQGSTFGESANKKQVEVIIIYYPRENKLIEVANRVKMVRNVKIPYARPEKKVKREAVVKGVPIEVPATLEEIKPFYPFAVLRDYIDGSLFYGRGEVEVIADRQENLNDLENQDIDNSSYSNNLMWQIDPQFADMAPQIESIPGAVYPIPKGALSPIERPAMTNDIDNKKVTIKDEMRRATAADEVIQGVSQEKGRTTATEISTQLNQANMRFSTKITNLESEGYAQLAEIMFRIVQVFVTEDMTFRILGKDGIEFSEFSPIRFIGDYEPHVKLDSTIKGQELEEGQKLNQMYQVILGNPVVDPREATRFILEKLGADDEQIEKMLVPQPGTENIGQQVPTQALGQIMGGTLGQGNATF